MPHMFRLIAFVPALLLGAAGPRTTADGGLVPFGDYREWVFLSSGLDMSYSANANSAGHVMFDNVFVEPSAWAAFKQTGHWPDKTVFVLENRAGTSHGSINQRGQFQTGVVMGLEAHVHDEARFKGGWAFFDLSAGGPGKFIPFGAPCYACHLAHGAVDTTFTQFYPVAKQIAQRLGTYQDR